jgi:hypothetical protein
MTDGERLITLWQGVVRVDGKNMKGVDAYTRRVIHSAMLEAGVPIHEIAMLTGWSVYTILADRRQNRSSAIGQSSVKDALSWLSDQKKEELKNEPDPQNEAQAGEQGRSSPEDRNISAVVAREVRSEGDGG